MVTARVLIAEPIGIPGTASSTRRGSATPPHRSADREESTPSGGPGRRRCRQVAAPRPPAPKQRPTRRPLPRPARYDAGQGGHHQKEAVICVTLGRIQPAGTMRTGKDQHNRRRYHDGERGGIGVRPSQRRPAGINVHRRQDEPAASIATATHGHSASVLTGDHSCLILLMTVLPPHHHYADTANHPPNGPITLADRWSHLAGGRQVRDRPEVAVVRRRRTQHSHQVGLQHGLSRSNGSGAASRSAGPSHELV